MSLLHWVFNKIDPQGETNWLSVKFAQWRYSRTYRHNEWWLKNPHMPSRTYQIPGAGTLAISENPTSMTAQTVGFSFSVSWSDAGLGCGGVLGINEARKLAEHILEKCNQITVPEEQLVKERYESFKNIKAS